MNKKLCIIAAVSSMSCMALFAQSNWFMAQTDSAYVKSVTATSELVEGQYDGKYLYPPINILDGDFSTVWCEADAKGPGIGEAVTVEFAEPVSFDEIQIVNGFASGNNYYTKNNRVAVFQLTQVAKKHFQQKEYTLEDNKPDWQPVKFALPQTAQTLTFKLVSVYKGSKYDDTCLGDIRLLYKGKVIPFENVAALKKIQEDNSKQMLQMSAASFVQNFNSLCRSFISEDDSCLYLLADNGTDCLQIRTEIRTDKYSQDYAIEDMIYLIACKPYPKKEFEDRASAYLKKNWHEKTVSEDEINGYDPSKCDYILYDLESYGYDRTRYELGNGRIITTSTVDYVDTTTVTLFRIENGHSVFIDGEHYTPVKKDRFFIISRYDGP